MTKEFSVRDGDEGEGDQARAARLVIIFGDGECNQSKLSSHFAMVFRK